MDKQTKFLIVLIILNVLTLIVLITIVSTVPQKTAALDPRERDYSTEELKESRLAYITKSEVSRRDTSGVTMDTAYLGKDYVKDDVAMVKGIASKLNPNAHIAASQAYTSLWLNDARVSLIRIDNKEYILVWADNGNECWLYNNPEVIE